MFSLKLFTIWNLGITKERTSKSVTPYSISQLISACKIPYNFRASGIILLYWSLSCLVFVHVSLLALLWNIIRLLWHEYLLCTSMKLHTWLTLLSFCGKSARISTSHAAVTHTYALPTARLKCTCNTGLPKCQLTFEYFDFTILGQWICKTVLQSCELRSVYLQNVCRFNK